jgi:hypothetical protein
MLNELNKERETETNIERKKIRIKGKKRTPDKDV